MAKYNFLNNIKSFFITPSNVTLKAQKAGISNRMSAGGSIDPEKNLSNTLVPIQMPRIRQDIQNWILAMQEAEMAIYPFRVVMQQMYLDTSNEPHVKACWEKRKDLTLLRKFVVRNENGETDEKWTDYFKKQWFFEFINYVLEAIPYGYSLISLGDCIENEFPELTIVRRWNISPDRNEVASITYVPNGIRFLEGEISKWHIWVKTPSDVGVSGCGYGLFYPVSYCAIHLRNNTSYNVSFNELFGSPTKVLKTAASNESERQEAEWALQRLGNAGGVVLKPDDLLEYIEAKSGAGYKSYGDVEQRMHKLISKLILGHADAMDSTPGKLGGQASQKPGELGSDIQQAVSAKQTKDGEFVLHYINNELLPRLREIGIGIPQGYYMEALNDDEQEEIQKKQNDLALAISEIVMNMAKGGVHIDPKYVEQVTGFRTIELPKIPQQVQVDPNIPKNALTTDSEEFKKLQKKLDEKKKPTTVTKKEWDEYKTDREYKVLTEDFGDKEDGMTKEEYSDYADDIKEHIENDIPLEREDGDAGEVHINCQCTIENGEWVLGDEACDDCQDAAEDYNSQNDDIQNKLDIFQKHINRK